MSTPKRGRPFTGDEPLTRVIRVSVGETVYNNVVKYSQEHNVSQSEVARKVLESVFGKKEK